MTPAPKMHPQPGDGWLQCACGHRHWGLHGAAGLLLAKRTSDSATAAVSAVVLQHRALWSDQGGTWGVPGGAVGPDETPTQGALREAQEEAGINPGDVIVRDTYQIDHGTWAYTTVLGELKPGADSHVHAADAESIDIAWVALGEVTQRELLPAFDSAWPMLLKRLQQW